MSASSVKFLSICSGIEAASVAWAPLGWEAVAFSEIEPFPSAVLAHHYPDVPNLGDMTKFREWPDLGEIDVVCGGTPCQSWSVAGKREGVSDPRGQLTFSFLKIAEVTRPRFIVWENVPGILSADKGKSFCEFLDELIALGYAVNCDILDAQFFGLAQRRKRVYVLCQHASFLMKSKSNTSLTTGAIAVLGILQNILTGLSMVSAKSQKGLDAGCRSVSVGLQRKMQCFTVQSDELLQMWLQNLAEAFLNAATEREHWGLSHGLGTKTEVNLSHDVDIQLSVFQEKKVRRSLFLSTQQLWKSELDDLFGILKSFTTLTELKQITDQKICIYAEMLHTIGWFISQSRDACPHLLKLESLCLTLTKEFTNYARQADEPIFRGERVFGFWDDFRSKTRETEVVIASVRDGFNPSKILLKREGLRGDLAPSPEPSDKQSDIETSCGQVAPTLTNRDHKGPSCGRDGFVGILINTERGVRKATVVEYERLMGFPDGYTNIPWRGKPTSPDGSRYKALGNSWAVPNVRWIGARIDNYLKTTNGEVK
jgi:site-specific DNA-cytosine methylase